MPYAPVVPLNSYWMDLPGAAAHVGVHISDVVAAVSRREMYAVNDHLGKPEVWMVRMGEVEAWAERRAQLAG
jgi:hypothetical protein